MRFEERELTPYAEPITASKLKVGTIYFSLEYVDEDMLIPTMQTVVFVGRNLETGERGHVYFQDIDSYREGVRYDSTTEETPANFYKGSENEVGHIFEFESALNELMKCALRRRKAQGLSS